MNTLFVLSYNFYVRARVTPCSFLCRELLGYILYGNTFARIRNMGLFCGVRQFDISDKTRLFCTDAFGRCVKEFTVAGIIVTLGIMLAPF